MDLHRNVQLPSMQCHLCVLVCDVLSKIKIQWLWYAQNLERYNGCGGIRIWRLLEDILYRPTQPKTVQPSTSIQVSTKKKQKEEEEAEIEELKSVDVQGEERSIVRVGNVILCTDLSPQIVCLKSIGSIYVIEWN